MNSNSSVPNLIKNIAIIIIVILLISGVLSSFEIQRNKVEEIPLNQLAQDINEGKVKEIEIKGNNIKIVYKDGKEAKSVKESEISLVEYLVLLDVSPDNLKAIKIIPKKEVDVLGIVGSFLFVFLPIIIFIIFFWGLFRQAKAGIGQAFSFSKARIKLFTGTKQKVKFSDVAGLKEAKEELQEIVEFLKNPEKFLKMGARIPKGVLLTGPAGVGKTLLAQAIAGEANVPFFHMSGSEFVEMFVGVGASRVRDLFDVAKKAAPSIIFIDELDAVGRQRGTGLGGGHDEREQTLNQILVEMDGFERETKVIVIAATNRPDVLDPALLRPGRFDRKIILDLPDIEDRKEILKIHSRNKPLAKDVNLDEIAQRTPGFSGADIENLMNEAAILAARRNKIQITQSELLEAIDKVLLGPERKSHLLSPEEKEIAAYHESGHAIVGASVPNAEPVRKISIVSRGRAAGYTLKLPAKEKSFMRRNEFIDEIATLLGGYVAERITFKDITTGASSDLEKATQIATKMVREYGMSQKLGPISLKIKEDSLFLGKALIEGGELSEKTLEIIDQEVSNIIYEAYKKAYSILMKKKKLLEKLAQTLIEKETIEKDEFEKIIGKSKK
ncbi:ATP-dependent zinc metalloprotease FtsH [bacterium HR34]|nr:ATP-dependent zinc metalloprotease FtsH [bacterium HR34]